MYAKLKSLYSWFVKDNQLQEQVQHILEEDGADANAHSKQESYIIRNILSITDKTVEDVMLPRSDIVAIDMTNSLDDIIATIIEAHHSRYPVYTENLDNALGVVHIKDIFAAISENKSAINIKNIMHDVLFVAPTMRILDLLLTMRIKGHHLALVVDEYGGVDGQITINDLIEEIVGDIHDEFDHEDDEIIDNGNNQFLMDARIDLEELKEKYPHIFSKNNMADIDEDIESLGGLVVELANHLPMRKEIIQFTPANIEFEIVEADPRRVKKVLMRPINKTLS